MGTSISRKECPKKSSENQWQEIIVHKVFGNTSALQPKTTQPSELYKAEAVHSFSGLSSLGVPGVRWQPQILAHHLTLSQTGGTGYAPTSLLAPPDFQTFRRSCTYRIFSSLNNVPSSHVVHVVYSVIYDSIAPSKELCNKMALGEVGVSLP